MCTGPAGRTPRLGGDSMQGTAPREGLHLQSTLGGWGSGEG